MIQRTIEQLHTDYLKMFLNLPLIIRKDIIAVIDECPMSYNVCYLEIKSKTEMSERILRYLEKLDLV